MLVISEEQDTHKKRHTEIEIKEKTQLWFCEQKRRRQPPNFWEEFEELTWEKDNLVSAQQATID